MAEDEKPNVPPTGSREYRQETNVAPGGKAFVVQHGNMIVYRWKPEYRIEQYDIGTPAWEPATLSAQPSRMLRAQYQVVPFDNEHRRTEIQQITEWRDDVHDVATILLHGPGGQGKTRLASHVSEAARDAGWQVLRAVSNRSGISGEELVHSELTKSGKAGIMVIADYAERWPIPALLALIQDPILRSQSVPLRFLLVARPEGTWWQSISYRIQNELQVPTSHINLSPLVDRPREWSSVIETACDAFLGAYALHEPIAVVIPHAVAHDDYALVLAAHMAALAVVDAAVHHQPTPSGSAEITEYLLGRERTHWMELHEADPIRFPTNPTVMGRTVFTATLTRSLSYEEGAAALHRSRAVDQGQQISSVLADHAICYPPRDQSTVLEPLYPDRLGEDFIAMSTPGRSNQKSMGAADIDIADPWAAGAIQRLLGVDAGESPTWLPTAMPILVETAKRWRHIAEEQLFPIVREHPQAMLVAGGAVVAAFSELPTVPIDLLEELERILPIGRGTEFAMGRSAVVERLAKFRLAQTEDPVQLAAIYKALRKALSDAGLIDREIAAVEKEVRLYRMLSRADPEKFIFPFAVALDAYSSTMMRSGQLGASIETGNEAVAIYRRLYSVRPDIFAGELARTLTNLGNSLLRSHSLNEALQIQQQAVRIRRSIDQDKRVTSDDIGLAEALVQLSVTLCQYDRLTEALDLATEAVALFRNAINSEQLNFEKGIFAHALEIKARILILMGMHSDATEPLTEAIEILRPLVSSNPAVHEGLVAQTLSQLGVCLVSREEWSEGIEALQEAVDIFSRLPARFGLHGVEPNYIGMLCNLGYALVATGKSAEAVPILTDAAEKSRTLLKSDPHEIRFLPLALHSLALALSTLGNWESALPASEESEALYRHLISVDSDTYMERWHLARRLLASILDALGRQQEASAMRSQEL